MLKCEPIESYSIRRVHQFADRDDQPDPDFIVDEWASERPERFASDKPLAEFWRMVGYYRDDAGEPSMIEVGDAQAKRSLVELYCRITGRAVPKAILDDSDTHNLPA